MQNIPADFIYKIGKVEAEMSIMYEKFDRINHSLQSIDKSLQTYDSRLKKIEGSLLKIAFAGIGGFGVIQLFFAVLR
jgi:hypothetical protein